MEDNSEQISSSSKNKKLVWPNVNTVAQSDDGEYLFQVDRNWENSSIELKVISS